MLELIADGVIELDKALKQYDATLSVKDVAFAFSVLGAILIWVLTQFVSFITHWYGNYRHVRRIATAIREEVSIENEHWKHTLAQTPWADIYRLIGAGGTYAPHIVSDSEYRNSAIDAAGNEIFVLPRPMLTKVMLYKSNRDFLDALTDNICAKEFKQLSPARKETVVRSMQQQLLPETIAAADAAIAALSRLPAWR